MLLGRSVGERFHDKIVADAKTGCWLWTGAVVGRGYLEGKGYGAILIDRRPERAHRVAWRLYRGEIPLGLHVLHMCDVRRCVNPDHLFLGTNADNVADRDAKDRHNPAYGEANGLSKLTKEKVIEIRALRGKMFQAEIGRKFGVSQNVVHQIQTRKTWRHVA